MELRFFDDQCRKRKELVLFKMVAPAGPDHLFPEKWLG
jgi:hypothetical protein